LGSNQIIEIPKEIGNLSNLQFLCLSQNQIMELPKEIGNLTNLQSLNLQGSQITELPSSINNLRRVNRSYSGSNWISPSSNETPFQFLNRALGLPEKKSLD
jgi:Leucine-rich repeat (LRR) protein